MKIKHISSGTEFTRNKDGNYTINKKGTGDYWIAKMEVGHLLSISDFQHQINKGWFQLIEETE